MAGAAALVALMGHNQEATVRPLVADHARLQIRFAALGTRIKCRPTRSPDDKNGVRARPRSINSRRRIHDGSRGDGRSASGSLTHGQEGIDTREPVVESDGDRPRAATPVESFASAAAHALCGC